MIQESYVFAQQDIKERQRIEALNEAEAILRATDKAMTQAAETPTLLSAQDRAPIAQAISDLKKAMTGRDHRQIRDRIDALNKASYGLAERLMDHSLEKALKDKKLSQLS
jgi:molecular chaperone DnaK (HSP70)